MQTKTKKKSYQSPKMKNLGKIGNVTNTNPVQTSNGFDANGPNSSGYNS